MCMTFDDDFGLASQEASVFDFGHKLMLDIYYIGRVLYLRRNTHRSTLVFDSLLAYFRLRHLGKGWIVRGTATRDCLTWLVLLPKL